MAAPGARNQFARRVIDDLVDFGSETSVQVLEDQGEVFDTLMGLRDDRHVENTKLIGLSDLITQAKEEIKMKEAQVELMDDLVMSDSVHSTVVITLLLSSESRPIIMGFPLMDVELEHVHPEYLVPSDGDIPVEDLEEDLEEQPVEDPIDYVADVDDDKDEEEDSFEDDDDDEEEHLAPADSTAVASPTVDLVPSAKEIEPFEIDESAATPLPPPAYQVARILSLPTPPPSSLTSLSSPLPQIPPLPTSPTYAQAPLGCVASMIERHHNSHHPLSLPAPSTSRKVDIPEADIPPRKRLLLMAPTPRIDVGESSTAITRQPRSIVARRVDYSFLDTVDVSIRASNRRTMDVRDHAALRDEVDTLRRYLFSLCTTHEQERVEARQALDRSEANNRVWVDPIEMDLMCRFGRVICLWGRGNGLVNLGVGFGCVLLGSFGMGGLEVDFMFQLNYVVVDLWQWMIGNRMWMYFVDLEENGDLILNDGGMVLGVGLVYVWVVGLLLYEGVWRFEGLVAMELYGFAGGFSWVGEWGGKGMDVLSICDVEMFGIVWVLGVWVWVRWVVVDKKSCMVGVHVDGGAVVGGFLGVYGPAPSTSRKVDIPEADIPPRKRLLLMAPTPRIDVGESSTAITRQPRSIVARRVDYSFLDTVDVSIRASKRRTMDAVEVVNLRRDHAALCDEVDTLRRYLSSLCTTHEQERVEARQDLDRSEANNRSLEARIIVLETQAYHYEWQRQDADNHATGAMMCIYVLEARARIDTLEDTDSSA
ncbi:hypothetical protein Tco_0637890 [Tanacetum coccineum]